MSYPLPDILLEVPRNPIFAVGIPIMLGFFSGIPTRKIVRGDWYKKQKFPPGRPSRQLFPFVWTGLYASMGWASYLAVQTYDSSMTPALRSAAYHGLKLYWVQLTLNLAWTPLFFVYKQTGLATVDSAFLTAVSSYRTIVLDKATKHKSTYFLAPYCSWLAFATYLSGGIWWLNRDRDEGCDGGE